jgi:hypothetical protein
MKLQEHDLELWKATKEFCNALRSGDLTTLTTRLLRKPASNSDPLGRADFLIPFLPVSDFFNGELMLPHVLVQLQKPESSKGTKRYRGK